MKAVIIATGLSDELSALNERIPVPLLPLVDRPFIQHVVEYLIDRGITSFEFVLSHLPEKIEHLLGEGTRWGTQFSFHLVRDAFRPYDALRVINLGREESILLVHADRLPQLPDNLADNLAQHAERSHSPLLYCLRNDPGNAESFAWTGWGWLGRKTLSSLPAEMEEAELEAYLKSFTHPSAAFVEVPRVLSVRSYEEIIRANSAVLSKAFPGLMLSGSEVEPDVWLGRNVNLHPTAQLTPPVYVGENSHIGAKTQLGPHVVIAENCVFEARSTVANAVVFPGSYVGQALELENVIVAENLLINTSLRAILPVTDDFILGSLAGAQLRSMAGGLISRLTAMLLLAFTWPLLLLTALWLKLTRPGPVLFKNEFVNLPASTSEVQWNVSRRWSFLPRCGQGKQLLRRRERRINSILLRFLPALINAAKGELSLVGVCPRSKEEVALLPPDWRALYLRSKAGIVTEAEVQYGTNPDEDELYSAEAFYSATACWQHDMKLLLRYFGGFLTTPAFSTESHKLQLHAAEMNLQPKNIRSQHEIAASIHSAKGRKRA